LKFLGDINTVAIEKTFIVLQKLSSQYNSFKIVLSNKIGAFPDLKKPRVIWIGIEKGDNEINKIYYDIERELKDESFYRYDNKFSPHITLGRVKYIKHPDKLADFLAYLECNNFSQIIKSIELMESKLTGNGPIYTIIGKFPFLR
jgi:RNA 2',3'-cyclic 3'-phosphodiesterase